MILLEIKFKLIAVRLVAILDNPAEKKNRDTISIRRSSICLASRGRKILWTRLPGTRLELFASFLQKNVLTLSLQSRIKILPCFACILDNCVWDNLFRKRIMSFRRKSYLRVRGSIYLPRATVEPQSRKTDFASFWSMMGMKGLRILWYQGEYSVRSKQSIALSTGVLNL